jgi:hypothetical protein
VSHTDERLFAELPPGAEGHFRLQVYAFVARVLANLAGADGGDLFGRFSFLGGYVAALDRYRPAGLTPAAEDRWWQHQVEAWEAREQGHLPLRALASALDLSADELRVLIAAGLVEEDIRFGALFAALQEPLAARRPCVGLLGWLAGAPGAPPADAWPACRALIDHGLLLVENRSEPRAEWLLRVPPPLWDAVRGAGGPGNPARGLSLQPADSFPDLPDLILPAELLRQVVALPDLLESGQVDALVVRGMAGVGRRTVLGAVARALGRHLLLDESSPPAEEARRLVGPLALLSRALPALRCDPGPGESLELPALPGYKGPVGITLGRAGGARGPLLGNALSLSLPPPAAPDRRRIWSLSELPLDPAAADEIVGRFRLTGGHIMRAAPIARAYARLAGRELVLPSDVQQAARSLNRQALETLATPLEAVTGWADLVVDAHVARDLRTLLERCRAREQLQTGAGPAFAGTLNRGVRALFSGPSGTGKTLAARVLAAELQMDLYRVDLAAVVNKYIGETERNLNQVLSRAEELDVLLLLDEGDALMSRRTDVRSANDRYANLETNYLLQRLESYEGVVIVTTNAGQRIDGAFSRRLDVVVDFAPPEAAERRLIWLRHLPPSSAIGPELLEEIAAACTLTGGQIRNAALHAALLALGDGGVVRDCHLEAALQREYRQSGAAYPLEAQRPQPGRIERLRRFAAELG